MANPGKIEKKSTIGSALLLLLLVVAITAIAVLLLLNPDVLGNLIIVILVAAVVIVIIVAIVFVLMAILALPYYVAKGETHQTSASYDLDDVEPVKEKDSRKKDE
jgi:hypothetical protein